MAIIEKFLGKTNIIGTFIEANDTTAKFLIDGKEFNIEPIVGTETFVSPLKRVKEGQKFLTMNEFLSHPKKSEKRKFKPGDDVMLVLHRLQLIDDETKTKKIVFRMQNALIFSRKLNIVDDYEYKGFSIWVSNIEKLIKSNNKGLPLFSVNCSTKTIKKENLLNTLNILRENNIITNSLNLSIYNEEIKKSNNYNFLLKEEYKDNLKNHISKEKLDALISFDEVLKLIKEENNFSFSFLMNGSKKNNPFEKYKKSINNNSLFPKSKIPLVKLINEDIESFFNSKTYNFDEGGTFIGKEVYGKEIDPDFEKHLNAPSILSIKNTYSDDDISHYIINIIVPDLIDMRKRAVYYLKNKK